MNLGTLLYETYIHGLRLLGGSRRTDTRYVGNAAAQEQGNICGTEIRRI